ncbi:protein Gemin2 [Musca vetustissima]|uniref:protein Gemin2 n=1 Tax=Musca vetustissima TaxID=27455 RepID=UPI002AB70B18|nr:protein Gemin2 [Musca vetustissima]
MEVDEDLETFQQQALEIRQPGENFDPTAPPQNGEEFLMHMLYERKRCPAVVVKPPKKVKPVNGVKNQLEDFELSPDIVVDRDLLPTREWKDAQSQGFLRTRSKILMLRQHLASHNYDNNLEPPLISDEDAWLKFCRENQPTLSVILRLKQRTLEQLLTMISEWLKGEHMEEVACSSSSAAANDCILDLSNSEQWLGCWLYAVLSCLHLPLEPNVHFTLRDIARTAMRLRSRLKSHEFQKAIPYNLFIYLIAKLFDQLDLMEFV